MKNAFVRFFKKSGIVNDFIIFLSYGFDIGITHQMLSDLI